MSKLIPPLLSTTPPPIGPADIEDNDDDEFGDFAAAADDTTYGCDSFSIPNTPEDSPRKTPHLKTPTIEDEETVLSKLQELQAQDIPVIQQEDTKSKDYQDKRKSVESYVTKKEFVQNGQQHVEQNGLVPNVPSLNNLNGSLSVDENLEESTVDQDDDVVERPPQLFDDDSEDKEEVSETPSNFSISFDDNVIDDDDEEDTSDSMPIELPNHVQDCYFDNSINSNLIEVKTVETCRNIQEFDDFDDEFKSEATKNQMNSKKETKEEVFEDCIDDDLKTDEKCVKVGYVDEDDDFGEFNTFASIPTTNTEETPVRLQVSCDIQSNSNESINSVHNSLENKANFVEEVKSEVETEEKLDDYDGFQFTNHAVKSEDIKCVDDDVEDEDFDDFADFSSAPLENQETSHKLEENPRRISLEEEIDDDFGDFDDYTTSSTTTSTSAPPMTAVPLLTQEKVYEETRVIFKVMFETVVTSEDEEYQYNDATTQSVIFDQIKNVTDAHALSYHWGKSHVQQELLKALNIDTRNMLHAHGMPMPKFAANLGVQPLEPVKCGILAPTPAAPPSAVAASGSMMAPITTTTTVPLTPSTTPAPSSGNGGDIPAAQFDWNASGLANPLDSNQSSTLFDLEQLAASLSLPTATTCAVGVDRNHINEKSSLDDDWDLWLQSVSKEELKPSSNSRSDDTKLDDNFLQPSKRTTYDTESVNSLQFPEMTDEDQNPKSEITGGDDGDFSDFTSFQYPPQMPSFPQSNMIPLRETYIDDVKTTWTDSISNAGNSNNHSRKSSYEKLEKPERSTEEVKESSWLKPSVLTPVLPHRDMSSTVEGAVSKDDEEDDFDDFQDFQTSSQLPETMASSRVEMKVLEVAKPMEMMNTFGGSLLSPTVLQPTLLEPVKLSTAILEPQAILWPDPGITDEELARFDLYAKKDGNYSQPTSMSSLVSASGHVSSEPVVNSPPTNSHPSLNVSKAPETKLSGPGGALMVEKHVVVPANKVILPFNEVLLPPNNQVVISKDLVLPILESSPRKYTPQQKNISQEKSLATPIVPQMASQAGAAMQDEDDWCDFVSTQPALAGSTVSPNILMSTGTSHHSIAPLTSCVSTSSISASTCELSLSIPQLRSMQNMQPPSKPPIPVITPRGLVQTKIPTLAPSTPVKSLPQTALHVQPPVDGYQPAIISTQFAAQQLHLTAGGHLNQSPSPFAGAGYLPNGNYQTTSIPVNTQLTNGRTHIAPPTSKLNGLQHDDDEWSDFMSSQPVNTGNHSLYTPIAGMATLHAGNLATMAPPFGSGLGGAVAVTMQPRIAYANDLPNIITNPVHFQSYPMNTPANVLNKKTPSNGVLHSKNKKPQNLNVARLPDLDFVAPKAKVYNNNKK